MGFKFALTCIATDICVWGVFSAARPAFAFSGLAVGALELGWASASEVYSAVKLH